MDIYREVLEIWGLEFQSTVEADIYGAPSRMAGRAVVLDKKGDRYLVEKHHFWNLEKKRKIAENIDIINNAGFKECTPYLKNRDGLSVCEFRNRAWMVQPFIKNDKLKRPHYLNDGEMGEKAAETLLQLYEVTKNLKMNDMLPGFSLAEHTGNLILKIERSYPEIQNEIKDVIDIVEEILRKPDIGSRSLFCHGDYHPLNILWREKTPVSVIDWEFSGYRHPLTDIANIVGCAGFESWDAFDREFVKNFLQTIKFNKLFKHYKFEEFIRFILLFRFSGWLNEWMNDRDTGMMDREMKYLRKLAGML